MSTVVEVEEHAGPTEVIGALDAEIDRAARSDGHVLITGDADTGHQTIARLIHQRSRRAAAPVAWVMCSGLPETLLESELFGHRRGSFVGAYRDKPGLLDAAAHGTLFLDDVGDLSARGQSTVLRFLEAGDVTRAGTDRRYDRADVRIIAGAHRDLRAKVASGLFSRRLFDRLNDVSLILPPLRDRPEDIPFLVETRLRSQRDTNDAEVRRVSVAAMRLLAAYAWPGNVRELENVVDRFALLTRGRVVKAADLPRAINDKAARRAMARAAR